MSNAITCTSTQCRYAQSGNWANNDIKNPIYIGTNSAGTYKYVGQWFMPAIESSNEEIKRITLNIYRNSGSSNRVYYIGSSSDYSDYASVLSTGITIALSGGEGWKAIDITGMAEYITAYTSQWYLLIGNPNTTNTYSEIAGYGSGKMLYLTIEYASGSTVYCGSNGSLVPYKIYRAENGSLVQYNLYCGGNGHLIKY